MGCEYRSLTSGEIDIMVAHGCSATDWSAIEVAEGFSLSPDEPRVQAVHFSGKVRIGVMDKTIEFFGRVREPCGIYHAKIHNCDIGNNVYISNIENYIANYVIEDDAILRHINLLAVEGASSFGNGVPVAVINEAGGREVPIYDHLSAQIAYLIAMYRDRYELIENLQQMIGEYVRSVTATMGRIGRGARLIDCRTLKNIKVGPAAVIEGVGRLENGTVNSCPEDPAQIGTGVIAEDFIVSSGAKINDNTIIEKCFVGQGTRLGRQYSATNSIFFANCAGYHGEACSVFAGPFTVTHHKSTLLISGLYSFLNAGSGSNQSNHMYKLGPIHQGVIERGSKTTSDSYLLWPARVGSFTLVMGRHYSNSDTSDLPFSYLIEHEDESILVPGVNLRSVGTVRDSRKWPKRDNRKDPHKLDLLIYNLLTPYTVQKILNGIRILSELEASCESDAEHYYYNGVRIERSSLKKGIKFYQMAVERYLGNCLVARLRQKEIGDQDSLRNILTIETVIGQGDWLDIAGLIAPKETVTQLIDETEKGVISDLEQLSLRFQEIYDNFPRYEWTWAAGMIEQYHHVNLAQITAQEVIELIKNWTAAVEQLDRLRLSDAEKEFAETRRRGFGLDGDSEVRDRDFAAVQGSMEENHFILELHQRLAQKQQTAQELIGRLEKLHTPANYPG